MGRRTNTAVWMEKYNRWQINVQKDGIRRSFTSSIPGRNGQRECNRKADEWLDEGIDNVQKRVTTVYDEWIESLKLTTSKSHWSVYEAFGRNWIKPACGHLKLDRLSEQHLQNVIDRAFADGKAKKTLIDLRACMVAFVKYCRREKLTTLVPEFLSIPKAAKPSERTVLQPNDIKTLFSCDTTLYKGKPKFEFYIHAFRFQVATGLRPGELIGLKWEDISNNCVHLRRSINKYRDITRGKNDNATRSFKLHKLTAAILQSQIELLKERNINSSYVFPDEQGECTNQQLYYKRWVRYRTAAGLSEVSPYELRHTFVSVAKILPEGLLKMVVGHSKDMDTYGVYSHELDGDSMLTANLLEDAFRKLLK